MNIGKVSTGLNAAHALNFRLAFEDIPQYGVNTKVQRSKVPGFRVFNVSNGCFAVSSNKGSPLFAAYQNH
jgi:hypothetical protein